MKLKLWQYAIILHPTKKGAKDGEKSSLVGDLSTILAKDQDAAFLEAARSIPDEHSDDLERVEIALRPF